MAETRGFTIILTHTCRHFAFIGVGNFGVASLLQCVNFTQQLLVFGINLGELVSVGGDHRFQGVEERRGDRLGDVAYSLSVHGGIVDVGQDMAAAGSGGRGFQLQTRLDSSRYQFYFSHNLSRIH